MALKVLIKVSVYINDILFLSSNHFEYREELELLFVRLNYIRFNVNMSKCELGATNFSCLRLGQPLKESCQDPKKLRAVRDSKPPSLVHGKRQFMELWNFFCSHVRKFTSISASLNRLTSKYEN